MTTIEDKIKLFSRMVYEKIEEEKQGELDSFHKQREEIINNEKQRLQEEEERELKEIEKKASLKANEIVARERLLKQQDIVKLKENLIEDALKEINSQLIEFTSTNEYEEHVIAEMKNAISNLEDGQYEMIFMDKDYGKFKDVVESLSFENISLKVLPGLQGYDFIGGFIIQSADGRIRIDNSLLMKMLEAKESVGIRVMKALS